MNEAFEHVRREEQQTEAPRDESSGEDARPLPRYKAPLITVMDENEVLSAFQVTVNAATWWVG